MPTEFTLLHFSVGIFTFTGYRLFSLGYSDTIGNVGMDLLLYSIESPTVSEAVCLLIYIKVNLCTLG